MTITVLHRCFDCNAYRSGDRLHLGVVGVAGAGPEEAPEAVLAVPRDRVHVEVRDALAHHVVHGHERTLRVHGVLHGGGDALHLGEEHVARRGVEVAQGLHVAARDHERVAGEERAVVEEGKVAEARA